LKPLLRGFEAKMAGRVNDDSMTMTVTMTVTMMLRVLLLKLLRASASALPPLPQLPLQGGIRASQPLALALAFLAL
jgi:hypothetical protein